MLPPDASPSPERLRIGQCTVDVLSREIHAPGARRPFRVTPKAMAVLLVLVAGAVWPLVFRPMSKWGKGKK